MGRHSDHGNARGFVLVSVLWFLALLTVVALALSYVSRLSSQSVMGIVGAKRAHYVADGAVQLVLANLSARRLEDRLLADGEILALTLPGGTALVTVTDENGKIDLNVASENLLSRLMQVLGLDAGAATALANAIADYRDEDNLARLNGAEDDAYVAAGMDWQSKDAAFSSTAELQQVYGMPAELFRRMQPLVTVFSAQRGVEPAVAPLPVLLAVSANTVAALESYVEERRLNSRAGLPLPAPPALGSEYTSMIRGITYSLVAVGRTPEGVESTIRTTVKIRRTRRSTTVATLEWQPYASESGTSQTGEARQ